MLKKRKNNTQKQEIKVMNENEVQDAIEVEAEEVETVEEETGKKKWPLKKTLLVAAGAVGGLVLGALVLGEKSKTTIAEDRLADYDSDESDGNFETDDETEETAEDSETK